MRSHRPLNNIIVSNKAINTVNNRYRKMVDNVTSIIMLGYERSNPEVQKLCKGGEENEPKIHPVSHSFQVLHQ